MNELTGELHALAAELTVAGVTATVDPGQVSIGITLGGVCALVEPAETVILGMGMSTVELVVPVRLITSGPYDIVAVERLDQALLLALPVAQPLEPVTRGMWNAADTEMPAVLLTARRRIPYPPPVTP